MKKTQAVTAVTTADQTSDQPRAKSLRKFLDEPPVTPASAPVAGAKAFSNVTTSEESFSYTTPSGTQTEASFKLFLIRQAWDRGVDLEDLADGFGPGAGTNGDWSAVRDASDEAVDKMLERALNHFFG